MYNKVEKQSEPYPDGEKDTKMTAVQNAEKYLSQIEWVWEVSALRGILDEWHS